jgi:hypothetical protein
VIFELPIRFAVLLLDLRLSLIAASFTNRPAIPVSQNLKHKAHRRARTFESNGLYGTGVKDRFGKPPVGP